MADEKILSYNDVVLRRSDLDILNGPYFLNDRIIEFYFSYLTSHYNPNSKEILLVPPSISFWIKECPDIKDFVKPLYLSQRELIIFPINDNTDLDMAEGGSHWSLLAYEKNANVFVHHDSSGLGMNSVHAKKLYRGVVNYTSSDAKYVECSNTPTQMNGYDCGLYVTAIAGAICEWYEKDREKNMQDLWLSAIKEKITPSFVSKMRNDILELVTSLMVNFQKTTVMVKN